MRAASHVQNKQAGMTKHANADGQSEEQVKGSGLSVRAPGRQPLSVANSQAVQPQP